MVVRSSRREERRGGENGGAVVGVGGAAGAGLLQVGVGGAVEVGRSGRSRFGGCGGGGGAAGAGWRRKPVGGARVPPPAVIGGEAGVDEQGEFRNGRLNSASLKHTAGFTWRRRSLNQTSPTLEGCNEESPISGFVLLKISV